MAWEATVEGGGTLRFSRKGRMARWETRDGGLIQAVVLDEEGARRREGTDGEWTPLPEGEVPSWQRRADVEAFLAGDDPGEFESTTFVGGDKIDGGIVHVLHHEATGHRFCFDVETGLLRARCFPDSHGKRIRIVFSDYRPTRVGFLPHRAITSALGEDRQTACAIRYVVKGREF
jgi:hypothetical protein